MPHACFIWRKKNIAFPISGSYELLALIAIVTIIPLQRCIFSAAALHRGTGTSNLRGSLAAKLDCTGWDSMRHRECAFNLKKVNVQRAILEIHCELIIGALSEDDADLNEDKVTERAAGL